MELEIKLGKNWLSNFSILLFLMVLFAHQREVRIDTLLRYGTILFVLVAHWMDRPLQTDGQGKLNIELTNYVLWMLSLVGYGFLTLLWCLDYGKSTGKLANIIKILIVCMVVSPTLKSRMDIHRMMKFMLIALCYMLVLLTLLTPSGQFGTIRMGFAIGIAPTDLARSTCLGSILSLYFFENSKKFRLFFLLLTICFSVFSLASGSKNSVLILVFQIGLFLFLISNGSKRVLILIAGIVVLVFSIYLLMEIPSLYQLIGYRFENMFVELGLMDGASVYRGSTSERMYFIRTAWSQFLEHPIKGLGFNNFSSYLEQIHYSNPKYSHCGFVELLSTTGIIGFVIYYSVYILILSGLWNHDRKDYLTAVLFVIVIRIFIFDISTISMYTFNNYFILMLAFAMSEFKGASECKI